MEESVLLWDDLFVISYVPTRNYLFKVSNWSTRIRCGNCSRLRLKTLERCQWRRSSAYCSLLTYFKLPSNYWIWTDRGLLGLYWKNKHFKDKIRYILRYVIVIYEGSHRRCSVKKGVLKNFAIFTGKHLCWSLYYLSYRPEGLQLYSNTGVFLWKMRNI